MRREVFRFLTILVTMLETFTFVSNKEEVIYNNSFNENMPFNKTAGSSCILFSLEEFNVESKALITVSQGKTNRYIRHTK